MESVNELNVLLGELVKRHRAKQMDQREFATRIGCSQKTLSRIEQGVPVNAETLFTALALVGQLEDFVALADAKVRATSHLPARKRGASAELDNDF